MSICRATAHESGLRVSFNPKNIYTLPGQRENYRPFGSIRCVLRCLTEAVPPFNLGGSKVQVIKSARMAREDTVIVFSRPLPKNAMHSPTSTLHRSYVFKGRDNGPQLQLQSTSATGRAFAREAPSRTILLNRFILRKARTAEQQRRMLMAMLACPRSREKRVKGQDPILDMLL